MEGNFVTVFHAARYQTSACRIQHILTCIGISKISVHFCLIYVCFLDVQRSSDVRTQSEEFGNLVKPNTVYTLA